MTAIGLVSSDLVPSLQHFPIPRAYSIEQGECPYTTGSWRRRHQGGGSSQTETVQSGQLETLGSCPCTLHTCTPLLVYSCTPSPMLQHLTTQHQTLNQSDFPPPRHTSTAHCEILGSYLQQLPQHHVFRALFNRPGVARAV